MTLAERVGSALTRDPNHYVGVGVQYRPAVSKSLVHRDRPASNRGSIQSEELSSATTPGGRHWAFSDTNEGTLRSRKQAQLSPSRA